MALTPYPYFPNLHCLTSHFPHLQKEPNNIHLSGSCKNGVKRTCEVAVTGSVYSHDACHWEQIVLMVALPILDTLIPREQLSPSA